jgi:hypothetical protein
MTAPENGLREPDRLDADKLAELTLKLVHNRLVVASALPPNMLAMVFMPLAMGGLGDLNPELIGNIVEDIEKAGPRSVNGYPSFFSCQVIHIEDWKIIYDKYVEAMDALGTVMGGQQ